MSARAIKALRVHELGDGLNQTYIEFVAFRDNLWVGVGRDIKKASEQIIEAILTAHPKREQIEDHVREFGDVCNFIEDYVPDALCGHYDRETRQIGFNYGQSAPSSPLVRKVTEVFRARSVEQTYSDEKTHVYKKSRIKGGWDWSQPFFHGTSSEYFEGIVRFGLKPMPHQTNYEMVTHEDAIFLTPIWGEAEMHAFHTASGESGYSKRKLRQGRIPMVVSVIVPDPARVIPDFDVDRDAEATWYEHEVDPQKFYSVNSEKASKHAGLFGYRGRIPAKFIRNLYFYSYYDKTWKRLTPDKFAQAVRGVQNYDQDFFYQRLGYPEGEM